MKQGYETLTEKEKQTLRMLLAGHEAKSMARHLGLSVHTINERLRDARRKLSASSSKEAARLLRQAEGAGSESFGDEPFGDARTAPADPQGDQSGARSSANHRKVWVIGGLAMIALAVAVSPCRHRRRMAASNRRKRRAARRGNGPGIHLASARRRPGRGAAATRHWQRTRRTAPAPRCEALRRTIPAACPAPPFVLCSQVLKTGSFAA